jgi:hypothetical protein
VLIIMQPFGCLYDAQPVGCLSIPSRRCELANAGGGRDARDQVRLRLHVRASCTSST